MNDVKHYESELSPCPFCGGKAKIVIEEKENSDTTHRTYIRCEDTFECGASIFGYVSYYAFDRNMQELVDKWNTRGINKAENKRKAIAREFFAGIGFCATDEIVDCLAAHGRELLEAFRGAGAI